MKRYEEKEKTKMERQKFYDAERDCPVQNGEGTWCGNMAECYESACSGCSICHHEAYLGNAFSLQMLPSDGNISVETVTEADIPSDVVSCIGHTDTANVLSDILGMEIPVNRMSVTLNDGDVLYVAQLIGGRLSEGATTLPKGFSFKFMKVKFQGK